MARKEDTPVADPVADAADELYTLPPESFIARRDEHTKALAATDKKLAAAVQALRKPTVAAWALNLLVRSRRDQVEQFVSLGPELAAAQRELDTAALQSLASRRQRVVHALVREARELAADAGHPVGGAAAYEVESTLHAALADPDIAGRLLEARMLRPESYAGLGPMPEPAHPPRAKAAPAVPQQKPQAVRSEERRRAEELHRQAKSALEEAIRRGTDAAAALAEAEATQQELADHADQVRAQLADLERRGAEAELDRRRLRQIAERARGHEERARVQEAAAAERVQRSR
ncbi:MAG: hypothetical protein JWO79_3420 [Actinomycetia bacterium]|nr:hypothetical protein [Actinomycetes bacterium]